jgi:hypothetical protein
MTPERAQEILSLGMRWHEWAVHTTPAENQEIMEKWRTMPGYTCYFDALLRLAYPEMDK